MTALFLVLAAQVQTVHLPPVPPTTAPPPQAPQVGTITARLLPDLVVREIRIENDSTMHVLVANQGTAAVTEMFAVNANAEIAGQDVAAYQSAVVDRLAVGEQKWVQVNIWPSGGRLTGASSASASVDSPYRRPDTGIHLNLGGILPRDVIAAMEQRDRCTAERGCVVELDETNNGYAIAGIPRGTPDRLDAPASAPERIPERG